jgi:hypothetical protein
MHRGVVCRQQESDFIWLNKGLAKRFTETQERGITTPGNASSIPFPSFLMKCLETVFTKLRVENLSTFLSRVRNLGDNRLKKRLYDLVRIHKIVFVVARVAGFGEMRELHNHGIDHLATVLAKQANETVFISLSPPIKHNWILTIQPLSIGHNRFGQHYHVGIHDAWLTLYLQVGIEAKL